MDIEMKVQILRACSSKKGNRCSSCPAFGHGDRNCIRNAMKDAATALSTLQAENETLRAELKSKVDLVFQQAKELDRRHLLLQEQEAELERIKKIMRENGIMVIPSKYPGGPAEWNIQKPRRSKED